MKTRPQALLTLIVAAAAWMLPAAASYASTFSISPLRVDFSAGSRTAALTVRNEEGHPVVVQAETLLWEQADGQDRLAPSRDLLVSPAVFTLGPNGSQLVRVALRREPDTARELAYRLALQEVPQQASPGFNGLTVALRLSLPVFVEPLTKAQPALDWSAHQDADGRLVVTATNSGSAHARIRNFSVAPAGPPARTFDERSAAYVLPGQSRHWTIGPDDDNDKTRKGSTAAAARLYRLKGTTDQGDFAAELAVAQ